MVRACEVKAAVITDDKNRWRKFTRRTEATI